MARLSPIVAPLLAAIGCGGPQGMEPLSPDGIPPDCTDATYPEGAVDPMTLGETLTPYAWPQAENLRSGARAPLDLATVPCNTSPEDIDWSPFDVLLFISVPAW